MGSEKPKAAFIILEQFKLLDELDEIKDICRLNYREADEQGPPHERALFFDRARRRMIIGFVIETYALVDNILSDIISGIYLNESEDDIDAGYDWRTKRIASFAHNAMDAMYPIQKLRLIGDIEPTPKAHRATFDRLNSLRNALAHSFFPEHRKDYAAKGFVDYRGSDIFSLKGLRMFE